MRRRVALLVGAVTLAFVAALGTGIGVGPSAAAGSDHHAAVIVSANGTVVQRVIRFTTDSVSGLEALRAAGVDPIVYGFSGLGAAICALHVPPQGPVVGCPADNSCLTCAGSTYWAYFEAAAGSSTFQSSRAGASSTRVHDGDVEGWKWGSGDPPPYATVASLTGPPLPGPPGPGGPSASSPPGVGNGSVSPGNRNAPTTAHTTQPGVTATTLSPGTGPTAATTASSALTATTAPPVTGGGTRVAANRAARSTKGSAGGGGSTTGLVVFGVVAAALAAALLLAHRARTRRA